LTIIEDELQDLDLKLRQLKIDYEHYFLGRHPREPANLRGEVQKRFLRLSGTPIRNTALRFRFNSLNSRFQAMKRQWDATLREIDAGTYKRHVFKADLRDRSNPITPSPTPSSPGKREDLFEAYREAARTCGQDVTKLTPAKLKSAIDRQEAALKKRLGCDQVNFRVVVSDGKVKLKASPGRG
jgi:hypothetical protein